MSNELTEKLKPLLDTFLTEIAGLAAEDAEKYGGDLAKDFATYLYRSHAEEDAVAERNLSHLRAQAKLLLAKHHVNVADGARELLVSGLSVLAQVGLATLRINLPAGV